MKKILTILLASVSTLAIAQKKVILNRSIDDDSKTMSIRVIGSIDGKVVNDDHQQNATVIGDNGYSKQVRFNQESGELFLKYEFVKHNEEFIFEKTVNAADKSEQERQQIIDDFEVEIELPGQGI